MQNAHFSHLYMIEHLSHADFIFMEIIPIKNEDSAIGAFKENLKINILVSGRKI